MPLPTTLPALRGPRLVLRAPADADAAALFAIHSDPEAMRYWSGAPWTDPDQGRAHIERDRRLLAAGDGLRWMIDHDGTLVGYVSLFKHDAQSRRAELGYLIARGEWGRGYAGEAVSAALDWAFGELGLHRIEADTDPRNAGSVRLLERLGFTREGLLRERWIVAGEICDTALYGLLAREWRR